MTIHIDRPMPNNGLPVVGLVQSGGDINSIPEDGQAVNEALQSVNEELQSINDELELSKEELQTTNEELTRLNEQVTEARQYAESIVATIREPLLVLDTHLRVKTANPAFYKTFQVNEHETEGVLIYDLGNRQWNIPALRVLLEEIIPEKTSLSDFEVSHNFPSLGERIILLNAREMTTEKTAEKLILLAIEDVTEMRMKTQELQLKEAELMNIDINIRKAENVSLEKAVEERTKELERVNKELVFQNGEKEKRAAELIIANTELAFQNEEKEKRATELIVANKELAFQNEERKERAIELLNANKELESFSYVSSHDLQEPLRKIKTFATLILDKEDQNLSIKGKDYFYRIQSAATRMQTLVQDLLVYSQTNSTERKFENTDLNNIIAEVKNELAEIILEKHAIIETGELSEASVIRFQFHQLFSNLISNSLKFSLPSKPPHITISSEIGKGAKYKNEKLSPDKNYCHITFSDNGIGFDPQYKDRIFEVFQRLNGKVEYPGTGIGLAIVKKIIENHNGIITASGVLTEGATFDIYIPA